MERIDDLGLKDLKVIQNPNWFCFGMDAVLLANYCEIKKGSSVVDLGTGTGIIPILLSGKHDIEKIYGIELQPEVSALAKRSVELNKLEDKIEILNMDLRDAEEVLEKNKFDVVTSNPPYMNDNTGLKNKTDNKTISRHEVTCTLRDVISTAKNLLSHNGRFFLVHRPNRLVDILVLLREYGLEPKKIRLVHPRLGTSPNLVLIKSVKAGKPDLKFDPPLYVYNEDSSYTKEILEIYGIESDK